MSKLNLSSGEKKNRIKRGSLSVAYTVVFIILIIAINLIVSSVAGSINLTIDLTAEEFISIGNVSRNVLGALQESGDLEATIYLCSDRDSYENTSSIVNGLRLPVLVRDLCEQYAYEFDGINVKYVNLDLEPKWALEYGEKTNTTLNMNNIIVEGKYHARVLALDAFYKVDSETKTYVGFNGELRLTTALLQSCISEPQVVSFTTGHGETTQVVDGTYANSLSYILSGAGFSVQNVDLNKEEISKDTKILIVDDPQYDFTDGEIEKLMDYTATYNSVIVLVDDSTPALPNLQDYLQEEWGINYKPFSQITEEKSGAYWKEPWNLSAQYNTDIEDPDSSAAYQLFKNIQNASISMPHSVELIATKSGTKDEFSVETVLQTTGEATSTTAGTATEGKFPLMLLSANADYVDIDDENSTNQVLKYQYVMLIGSTDFGATGCIDSASYGNGALLLAAARTMGVERYSLDIDYKKINDVALALESGTASRLGIVICVVLPAIILVLGLVVFFRRRHL